jgi:hypothetical protein
MSRLYSATLAAMSRARIDWIVICERASLDAQRRLSLLGIMTRVDVPSLPAELGRLLIVARTVDGGPGDEMTVGLALATPDGQWMQPRADGFDVEQAAEYLIITLRDVPLREPGVHRIAVALGHQEIVIDVPVHVAAAEQMTIH